EASGVMWRPSAGFCIHTRRFCECVRPTVELLLESDKSLPEQLMKERIFTLLVFSLICISAVPGQVPIGVSIQILKAEDARRYDTSLEKLLSDTNPVVRKRAALAAGRIGDDRAIAALVPLLEKDASDDVRAMAAFALGEIESVKGADTILDALGRAKNSPVNAGSSALSSAVRARLVEAAGKIAAANPKDEKAKAL